MDDERKDLYLWMSPERWRNLHRWMAWLEEQGHEGLSRSQALMLAMEQRMEQENLEVEVYCPRRGRPQKTYWPDGLKDWLLQTARKNPEKLAEAFRVGGLSPLHQRILIGRTMGKKQREIASAEGRSRDDIKQFERIAVNKLMRVAGKYGFGRKWIRGIKIDRLLAQAEEDIKQGRVSGPFNSAEEIKAHIAQEGERCTKQ